MGESALELDPIYLHSMKVTKPSSSTISAMTPFYKRHFRGMDTRALDQKEPLRSVKEAINTVYSFVGAKEDMHVIFDSSLEDIFGKMLFDIYAGEMVTSGKNQILLFPDSSPEMKRSAKKLESLGVIVKELPLNEQGQVTVEILEENIGPRTAFISAGFASNITGAIHPIWELVSFCEEKDVLLHVDVTDVLGKLYFRMQDYAIDFLTFSGKTLHAISGSAALFFKEKRELLSEVDPYSISSISIPSLIGFAEGIKEVIDSGDIMHTEVVRLRNRLEKGILDQIEHATVIFQHSERVSNISCIAFPGVSSEYFYYRLLKRNIHVFFDDEMVSFLKNNIVNKELANCALSFGLSKDTTEDEIERVIGDVVSTYAEIKNMAMTLKG